MMDIIDFRKQSVDGAAENQTLYEAYPEWPLD